MLNLKKNLYTVQDHIDFFFFCFNKLLLYFLVLTAVAFVNETVKSGNPNMTYQALSQEEAHVHSLDDDCKSRYQQALVDAKFKKEKVSLTFITVI